MTLYKFVHPLLSLLGDQIVDGFLLLKFLLHFDEETDTISHEGQKLELGEAQPISVGHIKYSSNSCGVNSTGSALLETQEMHDLVETLLILSEVRDLDVNASTQTGAQVRGAGQHVTQMLVPHELLTFILHGIFKACEALTEAAEHFLDVATLLHGDDSQMILLVNPNQEGLVIVVPDTTSIRPITGHTSTAQQGGDRLVEEEMVVDELFLFLICHLAQGVVLSLELSIKTSEDLSRDLLNFTTLSPRTIWRQAQTTNAAASSHSARKDVLRVKLGIIEALPIEVSLVLGIRAISTMTLVDYWVKEVLEGVIALFISGNTADGHDERVAWVVNTTLNGLVESVPIGSLYITVLSVHLRGEDLCHPVVVLAEVWKVLFGIIVLLIEVRHDCRLWVPLN